ncbi:AAA ATPase [Chloroherpeton thalassium ATCC 35110]|uniref:AAA ATPase n=1 Tax=Chloroherpeton thalassium (strain ATCC 35110 / GB-78) TaxID=517418 RepID=B3QWR3_CHLT3|nr:AAA family ATPase [Chloroherpeton thalassium]ACF13277.1 AAA ATPase [Chloroherpeton thalassium ATCC 35110]
MSREKSKISLVKARQNPKDSALEQVLKTALTKSSDPESLDLNPEFLKAFELMENSTENLFITGKAGTGKSTLLSYFKAHTKKEYVVLAPTGVAALNVGGQTIHSFFRFAPGPIRPEDIRRRRRRELFELLETIIIDEISMVRADLLDAIDQFMRLNGKISEAPFGGAQVIFIGDLFQLPPVISVEDEAMLFEAAYDSPYFFSAHVFGRTGFNTVQLEQVYRQEEARFLALLNGIRNKNITSEEIDELNERYFPNFEPSDEDFFITLTTTNQLAAVINEAHLKKLRPKIRSFSAELSGDFSRKVLPAEENLQLKVGAQVMFVKNDPARRWVNGTIGKVREIRDDSVGVEVEYEGKRRLHEVERVSWEMLAYEYNADAGKITAEPIGTFKQFPLKLAWAITIHKSQGKTFEKAVIDLGRGAFAHGQVYVALSRCTTLGGIVLKKKIRPNDLISDPKVVRFMQENATS